MKVFQHNVLSLPLDRFCFQQKWWLGQMLPLALYAVMHTPAEQSKVQRKNRGLCSSFAQLLHTLGSRWELIQCVCLPHGTASSIWAAPPARALISPPWHCQTNSSLLSPKPKVYNQKCNITQSTQMSIKQTLRVMKCKRHASKLFSRVSRQESCPGWMVSGDKIEKSQALRRGKQVAGTSVVLSNGDWWASGQEAYWRTPGTPDWSLIQSLSITAMLSSSLGRAWSLSFVLEISKETIVMKNIFLCFRISNQSLGVKQF